MSDELITNDLTVDMQQLDARTHDVATQIVQEEDTQKLKDLTHLFNLQHTKKQVLRTLQYDELLDSITAQMKERVTKRADQFSNKDLLDYLNTFSSSLEKAQKQISTVDETPLITVNQQNNTLIVGEELSRDSRRKVASVIESILSKINSQEPEVSNEDTVYYSNQQIDDESVVEPSIEFNEEE